MATRTISTKLEIEGEAAYKQSIANVNSELKNLKSQLSLVQAQYQNHQNTVAALSAKESALTAIHEAQSSKLKTLQGYLQSAQAAQSRYGAEVDALKSRLSTVNSALSAMDPKVVAAGKSWASYAQEAAKTETELKALQSSSGDTAAKQAELTAKLAETRSKMTELETATGGAAKVAGEMVLEQQQLQAQLTQSEAAYDRSTRAVNNLQVQTNNAQKELYSTEAELERTGQYLDEAKKSADGCATSIDEFGRQSKQAGGDAEAAFSDLKDALATLGLTKAVKELTSAISACVEAADAFEYQMGYVEALADTSSAAWGRLEGDILDLSNAYGVASTELAGAAYQALSAGVATSNAAEFMETAAQLSVAGMTSTTSAVDLLTNAINVYGLEANEAAHISDELLQVQNLGKTTINDLASVYSVAATQAAAFKVSIENLNTGFAVLTKNGIATANAGTYLSSMFTELADEGSTVAQILKEQTGMSFEELNEAGYSLGDTMQVLWDSVNGNSTSFSNLWSNVRAGRAALNIAQTGTEEYNRVLGRISDSAGLTAQSYEILADTGTTAANRMKESWTNLEIALGDTVAPAVAGVKNALADLFSGAAALIDQCPILGSGLAAIASGIVVLGSALTVLTVTNIPAVQAAFTSLWATLTASPAGAVVLALTAISSAVVFLATSFTEVETEAGQVAAAVDELTDTVETSRAAFEESTGDIKDSAEANRALLSSLEELLAVEDKSAATKARIISIVESLNSSIEGLNLSYDAQTDSINLTTDAIYDCIGAQEDQASNAAKLERLGEIEEQRAEIAVRRAELESMIAEAGEQVNRTLEEMGTINPYNAHLTAMGDYYEQLEALVEQDEALAEETEGLSDAVDGYAEAQDSAVESTETMLSAMEELETAYQEAYDSAKDSLEGQFDLWEKVDEITAKSVDSLLNALQSQTQYWLDYGANRDDVLSRGIDGLDAYVAAIDDGSADAAAILAGLKDATDEELTEIVSSYRELQSTQDDLAGNMADTATGYSASMSSMTRNTSSSMDSIKGYLRDLRNQGPQLISGLPAALNEALAGSSAREQYSSAGEAVPKTFAEAAAAGQRQVYSAGSALGSSAVSGAKSTSGTAQWESIGSNAATSFIDALKANQTKAYNAGSRVGSSALSGAKSALGIRSPSRKFREIGDYTLAGYEEGVTSRLPGTLRTMKAAAESSYQAFAAGLNGTGELVSSAGQPSARSAGGTAAGSSVDLGGVNIVIQTQPNQDPKAIADMVMRRMEHEVARKGAVFG